MVLRSTQLTKVYLQNLARIFSAYFWKLRSCWFSIEVCVKYRQNKKKVNNGTTKAIKKNHTHVKKVGNTSELLFGIYHLLMNLKNNYLLKKLLKWANKNVRNLIFTLFFFKKKKKAKHQEISLFYNCVSIILMIWLAVLEIQSVTDWNW